MKVVEIIDFLMFMIVWVYLCRDKNVKSWQDADVQEYEEVYGKYCESKTKD